MGTHCYRITVAGTLGPIARYAFDDFTIEADGTHTSLLAGLDQAALYDALNRIQSLGLELVALTRISAGQADHVSRRADPGPA